MRFFCGFIEILVYDLDQCRVCDENEGNCGNDIRFRFVVGRGYDDMDFVFYVIVLVNINCNNIKILVYVVVC